MHQLITIRRTSDRQLPDNLALLAAPIIGDETSPETEPLGVMEGVVVDERGHIAFFIARSPAHLRGMSKRVWMPLAAVSIEERPGPEQGLVFRTGWTRDQLMAQPDFREDHLLPTSHVDGGPALEGRWAPSIPSVVPPGKEGMNRAKAMRLGVTWGALGALLGVVLGAGIGYMAGDLVAIVTTALFFGIGAGIAGVIAGGTRESAVDAGELHATNPTTDGTSATVMTNAGTAGLPYIHTLESAINEKAFFDAGLLKATKIVLTLQPQGRRSDPGKPPSMLGAQKPLGV